MGGQNWYMGDQAKYGLLGFNVITGNYLPELREANFLYYFGPKSYNAVWDLTPSSAHHL